MLVLEGFKVVSIREDFLCLIQLLPAIATLLLIWRFEGEKQRRYEQGCVRGRDGFIYTLGVFHLWGNGQCCYHCF